MSAAASAPAALPSGDAAAAADAEAPYCWYCPPVISKIDPARYPHLIRKKMLLYDYPGGALIEKDMMRMMRWTCPLAMFVVTPLEWRRCRNLILREADKPSVKFWPKLQRNMALAAAGGAALGAVDALAKNWRLTEREVVEAAVALRTDVEQDRWSRTSGRLATAMVLPMIMYSRGPLLLRIGCGFGVGTVLSIPVSFTELDFAFWYALPGT